MIGDPRRFAVAARAMLIEGERQRFLTTELRLVAVKTVPWHPGPRLFGLCRPPEDRAGGSYMVRHYTSPQTPDVALHYPGLEELLQVWMGD